MKKTVIVSSLLLCLWAQDVRHPAKNLSIDAPPSVRLSEVQRSNIRRLLKAENEAKIFHLSAEDGCKCKYDFKWTKMPDKEAFVGQMFMDGEFVSGTSILVWYSVTGMEPKAMRLIDKEADSLVEDANRIQDTQP